jgi:hypothetical protein
MSWLLFSAFLELGAVLNGGAANYDMSPYASPLQGLYYTELGCELSAQGLFAGGSMTAEIQKRAADHTFGVSMMTFGFEAGYRTGPVEIGYRHSCYHPLIPYEPYYAKMGIVFRPSYEGGYDQVYVRIGTK